MPSKETEEIIKKVSHVTNEFDQYGDLKDAAIRVFNAEEKEAIETELKSISDQLNQPAWVNNRLSSERRGDMMNRAKDLRKQLDKHGAPDKLSGETMDALEKLRVELEDKIRPGLLPHEVMWRNPAGAADQHLKREKAIKPYILMWKNVRAMQNPHNTDQDLRNIETLRPSLGNPHGAATFMANARLPGNFAMTPEAKANFDQTFPDSPTIDTAMKQVERREAEEIKALQEKITALEAKIEHESGKKQRAKDRMAKAREARGKKKLEGQPSAA